MHACVHESRRAETGRKRLPSRLHIVTAEPDLRLELINHETMTWAKIKSRTLNGLSHPGAPK